MYVTDKLGSITVYTKYDKHSESPWSAQYFDT